MSEAPSLGLPILWSGSETWAGGYYELSIEVGAPEDLEAGLRAVWATVGASHPVAARDAPFDAQPLLELRVPKGEEGSFSAHGWTVLPSGVRTVCAVHVGWGMAVPPFLAFCLPLGALAQLDARIGGYPFPPDDGEASLAWRRPLDDWLADVGRTVFDAKPFRGGWIGFEVSGEELPVPGDARARYAAALRVEDGALFYVPARG